jgi:flagellar motor switch protein FliG
MDGKAILATILREATPEVRGAVRHDDPALFKQLRDRMFYFDDLALTDDNALARVFTAAPTEESALALKFAAPALREKVFRAVSPGRARALREHAAARAGLDEVEKAQQTVLDVALQLQSAGRILIDPRDPDLAGK